MRPDVGAVAGAVALGGASWALLDPDRAPLGVLLLVLAILVVAVSWVERGDISARDVTLVATLGSLAAAGRLVLAPVPGVQPVTVIVAAAGVALGPRRGFAVGALAALASNVVLGQGSHTPWQMLAWGGCGVAGGVLGRLLRGRLAFAAFCGALGFAFGVPLDLYTWLYLPHNEASLIAVLARGVPFNVAHAIGNVVLALVVGPELRRVLDRYARRARTEVVWA